MNYPTMAEVEAADKLQLGKWWRFLPSPTDEQRPIQNRLMDRFIELGGWTPGLSKAIGWD